MKSSCRKARAARWKPERFQARVFGLRVLRFEFFALSLKTFSLPSTGNHFLASVNFVTLMVPQIGAFLALLQRLLSRSRGRRTLDVTARTTSGHNKQI
jgi:hypothetical protein